MYCSTTPSVSKLTFNSSADLCLFLAKHMYNIPDSSVQLAIILWIETKMIKEVVVLQLQVDSCGLRLDSRKWLFCNYKLILVD